MQDMRIDFQFDRAAFTFRFLPFKVPYPVPFKLLGDETKVRAFTSSYDSASFAAVAFGDNAQVAFGDNAQVVVKSAIFTKIKYPSIISNRRSTGLAQFTWCLACAGLD